MAGEYIEFNNNSQPALNDVNINRLQQLIKQDIQSTVSGDTLPIGAIMPFGSDTIPENWLLCNGQAVSRTDYQELFNTIETNFGSGDGFTTFNLPDLRKRVPVGKDENDEDFDTLGNTGGEKEHTLTIEEMPSHNHQSSNYFEGSGGTSGVWAVRSLADLTGYKDTSSQTGGNQPHNILQPYIVQNYIIKAKQSAGVVATVVDGLTSTSATNALSANQGRILNDKFNYSTEEKVVGTWIDGKPIYRRIYYGTRNESDGVHFHFPVGFDTWKDVIKLNGSVNLFNGSTAPIPATFLSQSTINTIPLMILGRESDWNPNSFYITPSNTNDKVKDYIVIFEYTKTTD